MVPDSLRDAPARKEPGLPKTAPLCEGPGSDATGPLTHRSYFDGAAVTSCAARSSFTTRVAP